MALPPLAASLLFSLGLTALTCLCELLDSIAQQLRDAKLQL